MKWYDYIPAVYVFKTLTRKIPKPGTPPQQQQSSIFGMPIPRVYGKTKIGANIIHFGTVAKDGRPVPTPANAPALLALCEGPILGVARVFKDRTTFASLAAAGFTVPGNAPDPTGTGLGLFIGTRPTQAPWVWLTNNYPEAALGYPGIAYVPRLDFPYGAGGADSYTFEVKGFHSGTGGTEGDAKASAIVTDLITSAECVGLDSNRLVVATGRDGLSASSASTYFDAEGFHLSVAWVDQRNASDRLQEILDATNSTVIQTGVVSGTTTRAVLELVPLGDQPVGSYTPPNWDAGTAGIVAEYDLDETDYGPDGFTASRPPDGEIYNVHPIEYLDRNPASVARDEGNAYSPTVVDDPDPLDVAIHKARKAPVQAMHAICQRKTAQKISRIRAQRAIRSRNTYSIELPYRFCRLEPMDVCTVKNDLFGITTPRTIRLTAVEEDIDRLELTIEAEDCDAGSSSSAEHDTPSPESLYTLPPDVNDALDPPRRDDFDNLVQDVTDIEATLAGLNAASDDNKLTPSEKRFVYTAYKALRDEQGDIDAKATAAGLSHTAYDNAITAVTTALASWGLTYGTNDAAWCSVTSDINGATFRSVFATAYYQRSLLLNAIADKARQDAADAAADASSALTLAGSKTAAFYSATAPTNPFGGYALRAGDIWFNTTANDTNNCPDTNCKGHAADANGNPVTGAAPHRGIYWAHRWVDTGGGVYAWRDANAQALIIASEIAAGAIVASKIAADALQTSNYAESSGNATAGAKLDAQGTALKVAPGGLRIGHFTFENFAHSQSSGSVALPSYAVSGRNISSAQRVLRTFGSYSSQPVIEITVSVADSGARAAFGLRYTSGSWLQPIVPYDVERTAMVDSYGRTTLQKIYVALVAGGGIVDPNSINCTLDVTLVGTEF